MVLKDEGMVQRHAKTTSPTVLASKIAVGLVNFM